MTNDHGPSDGDRDGDHDRVILFAGGGSGGHLSPGLAIAERLADVEPRCLSIFACSIRPLDAEILDASGVRFHTVPAGPPSLHPRRALRFLRRFKESERVARDLISDEGVEQVVALGGFVAAPVVAAAHRIGIPVTLLNLDARPGRANRWMAGRCDRVLSAVDLPRHRRFAERVVGMPIRRDAIAPPDRGACRARLGLDPGRQTLVVTGASQGATSLNRFVPALARRAAKVFADWQVYHLTGPATDTEVRLAYERAGVRAVVVPFLQQMGLAWAAADLAVSRAGASSVAEAAANAVPTLFLPYPHHRDQHQAHNARPLVDDGRAVMARDRVKVDANVRSVGPILARLLGDVEGRAAMRSALYRDRPADAGLAIAELVLGRT